MQCLMPSSVIWACTSAVNSSVQPRYAARKAYRPSILPKGTDFDGCGDLDALLDSVAVKAEKPEAGFAEHRLYGGI